MRLVSVLLLEYQPGTRWADHMSADVLGVLVARAAGQPVGVVLRELLFEPLGDASYTGFAVPAEELRPLRSLLLERCRQWEPRGVRSGPRRAAATPGLPVGLRGPRVDAGRLPGLRRAPAHGPEGPTGASASSPALLWRR